MPADGKMFDFDVPSASVHDAMENSWNFTRICDVKALPEFRHSISVEETVFTVRIQWWSSALFGGAEEIASQPWRSVYVMPQSSFRDFT